MTGVPGFFEKEPVDQGCLEHGAQFFFPQVVVVRSLDDASGRQIARQDRIPHAEPPEIVLESRCLTDIELAVTYLCVSQEKVAGTAEPSLVTDIGIHPRTKKTFRILQALPAPSVVPVKDRSQGSLTPVHEKVSVTTGRDIVVQSHQRCVIHGGGDGDARRDEIGPPRFLSWDLF